MAKLNFNANNVAPAKAFEALPAGWYPAVVSGSELRETQKKDGTYLALEETIQGGDFHGRKVWHNITMSNPNPVAVEIGQSHLSALCHSTGVLVLEDSLQLHGIPMMVKLNVKDDPTHGKKNEVTGYKPLEGAVPPVSAPAMSAGATQQPAGPAPAGKPSWLNKPQQA